MPPAATPTLTRRALAVLALVGALAVGAAGPAAAQETTETVPPTSGVLIPGSTAPATTAAPAATTTSEAPVTEDGGGLLDLDANEKVWVIVGGLVAVAVLMLILTIIYWRHTKPERVTQGPAVTRADRKQAKRRRKATSKDPFLDEDEPASGAPPTAPSTRSQGPLDLEEILGTPDPSRSVFGEPQEPEHPDR